MSRAPEDGVMREPAPSLERGDHAGGTAPWYRGVVAAGYGALLLLLVWSRSLHVGWILAALAVVAGAVVLLRRRRGGIGRRPSTDLPYVALGVLVLASSSALLTQQRLYRIARHWDDVAAVRETRRATLLARRMDAEVERGGRVVEAAATLAATATGDSLFAGLDALRSRAGVDAIVVIGRSGETVAWAGDHRGRIPAVVREGDWPVSFGDGPLFSYLYFTHLVPGRPQHVAVALLLETDLPGGVAGSGFAARFEAATGDRPRFEGGPPTAAADWRLVRDGRVVVHARFDPLDQAGTRTVAATTGRRIVAVLLLMALGFLAAAWLRPRAHRRGAASLAPLAAVALAFSAAPLGRILGLQRLFSPAMFVLPIPGDFVLEGVLVLLLPLAALMATYRPMVRRGWALAGWLAAGTALVAAGFAGGMILLESSAGFDLLRGGPGLWLGLQVAALLLLAVVAMAALPRARGIAPRTRVVAGTAGVLASLVLMLVVVGVWRNGHHVDPRLLALWAVPYLLLALAVAPYEGRGHRLVRWLAAGWLASTAVVPHLWVVSGETRLRAAEQELATLGARADPYLDYLLRRFAEEVAAQDRRGLQGTQLLYEAWLASDQLAREPYPLEVTLWDRNDRAIVTLPLGGAPPSSERSAEPPAFLRPVLEAARLRGAPLAMPITGVQAVNQVQAIPLPYRRVVSVVVAPRRSFERASPLAAFLGGEVGGETRLELIPAPAVAVTAPGGVRWDATDEGWRSEAVVPYPSGNYHAHLSFRLPPPGVRFARGILVISANLMALLLLWILGRLFRGEALTPPGGWAGWFASFRARVTLALFGFFLMPTIVFGWAANRAVAGEVVRSGRVIAERSVAQAAGAFPEADLPELASRVGEDVLYHYRGELIEASSPETLDLGLYGAWMPAAVQRAFRSGEQLGMVSQATLGGRSYLVAYRRVVPAGSLGVPVWLTAGDVGIRQRELTDVVLLAALLGALLSLGLSVLVGRALARPLGQLRRAAAAVGAGRLGVRLPADRGDEFGELFASFNRMTRRLRRARARELHTARVLAWGQMARQVAHEIKNPLTPIKLAIQHIRRVFTDRRADFETVLDENVDEILREIERLSEIARVFSRYGAPAEAAGPPVAVDAPTLVREAMTLYAVGDEGIDYHLEAEPVPPVLARPGELKEVMLNLLENARTAVVERGNVEVRILAWEDGVRITVHDDGVGISPQALPQVFEPQFSTRSAGTGLGLAIVRRLVEGWGGTVRAESEPGDGTTIVLDLVTGEAAPS